MSVTNLPRSGAAGDHTLTTRESKPLSRLESRIVFLPTLTCVRSLP